MESFCDLTRIWGEIFESFVCLDGVSSESEGYLGGSEERYDFWIFGPLEDILFRILEGRLSVLERIGDMSEHIESCLGIAS